MFSLFCFRLQRTGIHPILIILMAVAGVILLLPGVCAAGFMMLGGLRRNRLIPGMTTIGPRCIRLILGRQPT